VWYLWWVCGGRGDNSTRQNLSRLLFPLLTLQVCILRVWWFWVFSDEYNWLTSSFSQSVLRWSIAVSTICRHSSRVVAFLQAVARPKFRVLRSASIARSQMWLGLPAGRFQSRGTRRIHAARARWWSSRGELRALLPKSRRRLLVYHELTDLYYIIHLSNIVCLVRLSICEITPVKFHKHLSKTVEWLKTL